MTNTVYQHIKICWGGEGYFSITTAYNICFKIEGIGVMLYRYPLEVFGRGNETQLRVGEEFTFRLL